VDNNIERLRTKHGDFIYEDYSYNYSGYNIKLNYTFRLGENIVFKPSIVIANVDEKTIRQKDELAIENFVFNIGMVLIPSYWKTTVSPKIIIRAAHLSEWQLIFWSDLFMKGMGQFYYENKIDVSRNDFFKIISASNRNIRTKPEKMNGDKVLVPVGGGKDSAVTLEHLKTKFREISAFIMKPSSEASYNLVKTAGFHNVIEAENILDPAMLEMNKKGFLNGHTPYSALLAFIGTFIAMLTDHKHIAFSNERSSEEGNISYLGVDINHQYSKTFEFEGKFREYNKKVLSDVEYFSFLRPLYEIQIAKLFSKHEDYFSVIRSCNVGQKEGVWCSECPKCLSTFTMLYPYLGPIRIREIFPKNIFNNAELRKMLKSMVDENETKPFECVGTREETKIALYLSLMWHEEENMPDLLKYAKDTLLAGERDMKERAVKIINSWNSKNYLNARFTNILKNVMKEKHG